MTTGSTFWSALIFGVNRLPTIFMQPFLGVLTDHLNKKWILIGTDVIRGFCVIVILLGLVQGWLNQWHLLVTTWIISTAEAFRLSASMAMIPNLLNEEDYEHGVALNQSLTSTIEVLGLMSVGIIIGFFGVSTAVLIDVITFFICAFLLLFTRLKKNTNTRSETGTYISELVKGIKLIKTSKVIVYMLILVVFMNAIITPFNALQAPLVIEILHSDEIMLSIIGISIMAGGIMGSLLYPIIKDKISEYRLIKLGSLSLITIYAFPLLIGEFLKNSYSITICIFVSLMITGALIALLQSFVSVSVLRKVKPEYLGRVNSILMAISMAMMPILSFITSWLVLFMRAKMVFIGCMIISILFILIGLSKRFYNKMLREESLTNS